MPTNLENSAGATRLEKVSFHSNTKERPCQIMFKLVYNCTHFTCQQGNAQNSSSKASTVREPRTSRYTYWVQKRQRNQRSNCQHLLDHEESKGIPKIFQKIIDYVKAFDCMDHNTLWKIILKKLEYQTTLPVFLEIWT